MRLARELEFGREVLSLVSGSYRLAARYLVDEPEMVFPAALVSPLSSRRHASSKRPWPEPSPKFPGEDADAVLRFPDEERQEFAARILSRYARQICTEWADSAREALAGAGLEEVSDAEFARLFDETIFARNLDPSIDAQAGGLFSAALSGLPPGRVPYVVDLGAIRELEALAGIHLAPTVSLFSRGADAGAGDGLRAEAIRINGLVLTPADGAAWELAKYFVLQGAAMTAVLLSHPRAHFPMDSINAITKSALPAGHPLRELLIPHTWLTLPLNRRVQFSPHSLVANDQSLIYSPFPATGESCYRFKKVSVAGLPGSRAYPRYAYPLRPAKTHSGLGQFWDAYYDTILGFTSEVARSIPEGDAAVAAWADGISEHVPGFPDARAIFDGDTLARAVAYYVFDVSVLHATEHASFGALEPRKVPLRLRMPPPSEGGPVSLDRAMLVEPIDVFRQSMARKMFFRPTQLSLLKDVRYGFREPRLRERASAFIEELRETDRRVPRRYFPLEEISASIQY